MKEENSQVDASPRCPTDGPDASEIPSMNSGVEVSSSEHQAHDMVPTPDGIILLMGTSGAGKSRFINRLIGKNVVREGHTIDSGQYKDQLVDLF